MLTPGGNIVGGGGARTVGKPLGGGGGGTGVTTGANITDNAIVRGDGGGSGIQDSGVLIDDSDNVTGATTITVGTATGDPSSGNAAIQAEDDAGDNAWLQAYNGDSGVGFWLYASASAAGSVAQLGADASSFDPGIQLLSGAAGDINTFLTGYGGDGQNTPFTASVAVPTVAMGGPDKHWATGNISAQYDYRFFQVQHSAVGASTFTRAVTVHIEGPPAASTNVTHTESLALMVAAGTTLLRNNSVGDAFQEALLLENETAAVTGTRRQNSPAIEWVGAAWDTGASASEEVRAGVTLDVYEAEGRPSGWWTLYGQLDGGSVNTWFTMDMNDGFSIFSGSARFNAGLGSRTEAVSSGSSLTFDVANGNFQSCTLNNNVTSVTLTPAQDGATSTAIPGQVLRILFTQGVTGGTLTGWPGSVVWDGGSAPTLGVSAGDLDLITLVTHDGGTTWIGSVISQPT